MLSWFSPMLQALTSLRYLWDREVLLRDTRLREILGEIPATPLVNALRTELRALAADSA